MPPAGSRASRWRWWFPPRRSASWPSCSDGGLHEPVLLDEAGRLRARRPRPLENPARARAHAAWPAGPAGAAARGDHDGDRQARVGLAREGANPARSRPGRIDAGDRHRDPAAGGGVAAEYGGRAEMLVRVRTARGGYLL